MKWPLSSVYAYSLLAIIQSFYDFVSFFSGTFLAVLPRL